MYLDKAKTLFENIQKRQQQLSAAGFNDEFGAFRPRPLIPWTEEEVQELERQVKRHLGYPLPAAYREFLLWAGKGGIKFMECTGFYKIQGWEGYAEMREEAKSLLMEEDFPQELPEDAIVFFLRRNNFLFLRLSEGDDPPVYCYPSSWYIESQNQERKKNFGRASERLSKWMEKELEDFAKQVERMAERGGTMDVSR